MYYTRNNSLKNSLNFAGVKFCRFMSFIKTFFTKQNNAFYLFILAVLFLPFYRAITSACLVLSMVLFAVQKINRKEPLKMSGSILWYYVFFLFMVLLSLTQTSPEFLGLALKGIKKWGKYLLFFLL